MSVRLQQRRVTFDDAVPEDAVPEDAMPDEPVDPPPDAADEQSVSYSGILITSYDSGTQVAERWIPLGIDPSEADDERLIEQLREALLWQAGRPPQAAGE